MKIVPDSYGAAAREANDCHEPAGNPTGGQFCSGTARARLATGTEAVMRRRREAVVQIRSKLAQMRRRAPAKGHDFIGSPALHRRLVALGEANDCHEPAGTPAGGRFCSGLGGTMPPGFLEGSLYKEDLYHGTSATLTTGLRADGRADEYGVFLSPRPRYARNYGSHLYRARANITRPLFVEEKTEAFPGGTHPRATIQRLAAQGYDSVVVGGHGQISRAHEVIIFDPSRVWVYARDGRTLEANDCHEPAGKPTGGQFCGSHGSRRLALLARKLPHTEDPQRTAFLLPDGTRLTFAGAGAQWHKSAIGKLGFTLQGVLGLGVVRYKPGVGIEVNSPITQRQASMVIDDAIALGRTTFVVDTRVGNTPEVTSRTFDIERVSAGALMDYVRARTTSRTREANDCHEPAGRPTGGRFCSKADVVRPTGWRASNGVSATWTRPGHLYRGMTQAEYLATVGQGLGVQSRQDFSLGGEGTSFSHDAQDAEGYVNFGRTDPRTTGEPTYVVEVASSLPVLDRRDGYFKSPVPVPPEAITRLWEMHGDAAGNILAHEVSPLAEHHARAMEARLLAFQADHPKLEMSGAIDRTTGAILYTNDTPTTTDPLQIGVDDALHVVRLLDQPDGNVLHYHTHPLGDAAAFSDGDWGAFAWSHVGEMRVITRDAVYRILKTPAYHALPFAQRTPRALRERWNLLDTEMWDAQWQALDGANNPDFVPQYVEAINRRLAQEFGVIFTKRPLPRRGV